MLSGFRKRQAKGPIPRTHKSPQTGQVITSSGNLSLDALLGGGLPIGSICLIEEDKFATYSKVLAKYFLAEGIFSGEKLFFGTLDDPEMINKLPNPISEEEIADEEIECPSNALRIAWRYNDYPMVNPEKTGIPTYHYFNLMEPMSKETFLFANYIVWCDGIIIDNTMSNETDEKEKTNCSEKSASEAKVQIFNNPKYQRLLENVTNNFRDVALENVQEKLRRVCLTSLASPMWYDDKYAEDLLKFLTILRTIIRSSVSVCFITIPMHLVAKYDDTLVSKIRNLVDFSIELESFAGSEKETNPAFKEYNGLLHLRKITAINTLSAYIPETTDMAFKLRRKSFVIEKLHLPPELQDDNTNSAETPATLSCGSNISPNPKISLDF